MLGSDILDVAIGLVCLFLLLSLICSAANELLEAMLKKRAKDLEQGITELLGNDEATKKFISKIYDHGLVKGLYRGNYATTPKTMLPSYIPSRNFALALLSITRDPTNPPVLPKNVKSALDSFEKTAANDTAELQKSVEDWYNSAMDRVSGWYKRRTQLFIFAMGCMIAMLVNADCVQYAQRLSKDSSLRQSVVAMAEATARSAPPGTDTTTPVKNIQSQINALDGIGLPVGWGNVHYEHTMAGGLKAAHDHVIGWLLTALAVSLGAPFWFDTLNKLIVVRSTVKPHEKSREESSKDATMKPDATGIQPPAV